MHVSFYLPPYSTSPRAELMSAIEMLSKQPNCDIKFRLLAAIAQSIFLSEECEQRFLETGFKAAIDIYDTITMNTDYEKVEKDPSNPMNWDGYATAVNNISNHPQFHMISSYKQEQISTIVEAAKEFTYGIEKFKIAVETAVTAKQLGASYFAEFSYDIKLDIAYLARFHLIIDGDRKEVDGVLFEIPTKDYADNPIQVEIYKFLDLIEK